jgi:two-component system response regulator HydG
MQAVYRQIDHAARSSSPVLITGETGTGKELVARAIHAGSLRALQPYITLNAGALPKELAEAELFGHERGAFTGADQARAGRFRAAHRGSLLIDELNSLPLTMQPQLLRTLDCGEVWPVGADAPIMVDVRVIAATNQPLEALVAAGGFRADLMYRIRVLEIRMPPLRERVEDIPHLVQALLRRNNSATTTTSITPDALAALLAHPWPGNVRELANAVNRAQIHAEADSIPPNDSEVPNAVLIRRHHVELADDLGEKELPYAIGKARAGDTWAERVIRRTLAREQGNVTHAAAALEMNRAALQRLMRRFGILAPVHDATLQNSITTAAPSAAPRKFTAAQ